MNVSESYQLKRPAIFIRNTKNSSETQIKTLLNSLGAIRIQINFKTKDMKSDLVVAYFNSEEQAFQALKKLKTTSLDGSKITATYK